MNAKGGVPRSRMRPNWNAQNTYITPAPGNRKFSRISEARMMSALGAGTLTAVDNRLLGRVLSTVQVSRQALGMLGVFT